MVIIRATRTLLQRLGPPNAADEVSTTMLGDWYATALTWRPRQVALLVSQHTLLPVLMPLAPAATLLGRFPAHLAEILTAHAVPASVITAETKEATSHRLGPTTDRSLRGSMNEFAFLAEHHRNGQSDVDLLELSLELSRTPCGPLYGRHVSPDRELTALVASSLN